jgi:hypothetical protein
MPRAVKAPNLVTHDVTAPPVVQAAQVALVVMGLCKASTWAEVVALFNDAGEPTGRAAAMALTPEQAALLDEHRAILPYLSRNAKGISVARTVYACPVCGRFGFLLGKRTAPTRCGFSVTCPGKPVKARSTQQPKTSPQAPEADPETAAVDMEGAA